MGFVTDAVYGGVGSDLELTTAWSVTAGVEHHWNRHGGRRFTAGMRPSHTIKMLPQRSAQVWHQEVLVLHERRRLHTRQLQPRFQFLADWKPTVWNPIADLELGLDILYNHINSAFEGPVTVSANGTIPPGLLLLAIKTFFGRAANSAKASCRRLTSPPSNLMHEVEAPAGICHHLFPPGPPSKALLPSWN